MPGPDASPDPADDVPSPDDLLVLEDFVADNGDLLKLEAEIGRFNIFDALGVVNRELSHSNFLAWLLDPGESHGLGGLFLRAVLMDLLRNTPPGEHRLFSPIKLDGGELRGIDVRREWKNIDLLITGKDPAFLVALENKIGSSEHSNQLKRYHDTIENDPELSQIAHRQFVYLTPEGDEPSEEAWTVYSYAQLHDALRKTVDAHGDQMGDDVLNFLEHYLSLIRSRLMSDETIEELCREIYKNHRQAIDLIVEHVGSGSALVVSEVMQAVEASDQGWIKLNQTGRRVVYGHPTIAEDTEPIGKPGRFGEAHWLVLRFEVGKRGLRTHVVLQPVADVQLRKLIVERLVTDKSEFGFRLAGGGIKSTRYARLSNEFVIKFDPSSAFDGVKLKGAVTQRCHSEKLRFQRVADAVSLLLAKHKKPTD